MLSIHPSLSLLFYDINLSLMTFFFISTYCPLSGVFYFKTFARLYLNQKVINNVFNIQCNQKLIMNKKNAFAKLEYWVIHLSLSNLS